MSKVLKYLDKVDLQLEAAQAALETFSQCELTVGEENCEKAVEISHRISELREELEDLGTAAELYMTEAEDGE